LYLKGNDLHLQSGLVDPLPDQALPDSQPSYAVSEFSHETSGA
jgi:hypothetical protein